MKISLLLLVLVLSSQTAFADSIHFGAVYRCDEQSGRFEVNGYVDHNDLTTIYSGWLQGLVPLADGEHKLSCRIGGKVAKATVNIYPASNGECMGAGYAKLSGVTFDGKEVSLFPSEEPFNWSCVYGPMLIRLYIASTYDGQLFVVNRCVASKWTWDKGYEETECTREEVAYWRKP